MMEFAARTRSWTCRNRAAWTSVIFASGHRPHRIAVQVSGGLARGGKTALFASSKSNKLKRRNQFEQGRRPALSFLRGLLGKEKSTGRPLSGEGCWPSGACMRPMGRAAYSLNEAGARAFPAPDKNLTHRPQSIYSSPIKCLADNGRARRSIRGGNVRSRP
jgi:hypothetical protein